MITEQQIEEYFRTKVEEFRARGVPVTCLCATFFPEFQRSLTFNLECPGASSGAHGSLQSAFEELSDQFGNPATKAAELRAQAEQLLKSADELEGKQ